MTQICGLKNTLVFQQVKNWVPSEVRLRVDFSTVGPNGRQCLPPSSPPQSLADTAHADEDLYAGFTGMKGDSDLTAYIISRQQDSIGLPTMTDAETEFTFWK